MTRRSSAWTLWALGFLLVSREGLGQAVASVSSGAVPRAYTDWLNRNARFVSTLSATAATNDLSFFQSVLRGKRLVMLGESAHGTSEFTQAKTRLIRYLHERLGFNVLVFESSYFDCRYVNDRRAELDAEDMLRGCLYQVWQTEEVLELFEYIKSTEKSARPLRIAGMDVQETGMYADKRNAMLYAAAANIDPSRARAIRSTDSLAGELILEQYRGKAPVTSFDSLGQLRAAFDSAAQFFDSHAKTATGGARDTLLLARETARAMAYLATFRSNSSRPRSTYAGRMIGAAARDSGMAVLTRYLSDEEFRGEKLIVWAHNGHLMMDDMAMKDPLNRFPPPPFKVMGSQLAETHRRDMYVMGLHMASGKFAYNDRSVDTVTTADSGSMELILRSATKGPALFVDISRAANSPATEWLYSEVTAKQWGSAKELQVLRNQYDGLFFIQSTSAPRYLPYRRVRAKPQ